METPFNQLQLILAEFKKKNDGQSLRDAIAREFKDDGDKLAAYTYLGEDGSSYYREKPAGRIFENVACVFEGGCKRLQNQSTQVTYLKVTSIVWTNLNSCVQPN